MSETKVVFSTGSDKQIRKKAEILVFGEDKYDLMASQRCYHQFAEDGANRGEQFCASSPI